MGKIINIIRPDEDLELLLSEMTSIPDSPFTFHITDKPFVSAEILFLSFDNLSKYREHNPEFRYIPFIVYGKLTYLNRAFALGASDYIKPPYSLDELLCRSTRLCKDDRLSINGLEASFDLSGIRYKEQFIPFTESEYKILHILIMNIHRIVDREIFHYRLDLGEDIHRSLDVHMNSLRNKLEILVSDKETGRKIIKTVRGKGYMINSQFTCG
ncbi:MAG: response regulator transcription factor [Spirochaetales bacterium]|nr:response regulator transcription factor [Spirochaetales bacterium]